VNIMLAYMAPLGEIPLAGGGSMSAVWMPLCGQGWAAGAASFVAMWTVMMALMMLPSFVPLAARCSGPPGTAAPLRRAASAASMALGYLAAWALLGAAIYPAGAGLAEAATRSPTLARAIPSAGAVLALGAGLLQFTQWKVRHLQACASGASAVFVPPGQALRLGWRMGYHCMCSCAGLTAVLLAHGCMEWVPMVLATLAISCERLMPGTPVVRQTIGLLLIGYAGASALRA
jgi:predicted metal-binding membrane protein